MLIAHSTPDAMVMERCYDVKLKNAMLRCYDAMFIKTLVGEVLTVVYTDWMLQPEQIQSQWQCKAKGKSKDQSDTPHG